MPNGIFKAQRFVGGAPPPPPPPPPPAPAITLTALSGGSPVVGTPFSFQAVLSSPSTLPLTGTPENVSGTATFSPTSVGWSLGDLNKVFSATWAAAGAASIRVTAPGGLVSNTVSVTVSPAPPPPPPPPPGSTIVAIALTDTATTGTKPFTIGQAFAQGDIPSGTDLASPLQMNVMNRWPDNSVKFALISGTASLTTGSWSNVYLTTGTAVTGSTLTTTTLKATGISATIDAAAYGSASWAVNDTAWDSPFITQVSGPVMSSWVYRKQIGSDAHLTAWLEVRLYSTGEVEVLPWIENGYADVASPVTKTAVFTFTLGGTTRCTTASLSVNSHSRSPLVSGTVQSYWLGATQHDVVVQHDKKYLQYTGLVPSMAVAMPANASILSSIPTTYTPFQQGWWDSALAVGGYHNGVDLIPEWETLHLASADIKTWKGVVFQGYSAGRYRWVWRDSTTNRAPLYTSYSTKNITSNSPGGGWDPLPNASNEFDPLTPLWSLDHGVSIGYYAYMLTGRWYFMDQLQLAATTNFLMCPAVAWRSGNEGSAGSGTGVEGIFDPRNTQVRGMAWGWRTMLQAACLTPDSDTTLRTQFLTQIQNNLDFVNTRYTTGSRTNNLGWVLGLDVGNYEATGGNTLAGSTSTVINVSPTDARTGEAGTNHFAMIGGQMTISGETRAVVASDSVAGTITVSPGFSSAPAAGVRWDIADGRFWDSPWMQDYIVAVLGLAKYMSLPLATGYSTKLDNFFNWKSKTTVGRMGAAASSTEWPYRDSAVYAIAIGTSQSADRSRLQAFYTDWGTCYANTWVGNAPANTSCVGYVNPGSNVDGNLRPLSFSYIGQYTNFMRGASYAVQHAAPGAATGWARIAGTYNFLDWAATIESEGHTNGAYAVEKQAYPSWFRGSGLMDWVTITGSALSNNTPTNTVQDTRPGNAFVGPVSRMNAYCGVGVFASRSEAWLLAAGGHGDFYGNGVYKINLKLNTPTWVEVDPGSSGAVADYFTSASDPTHARYLNAPGGTPGTGLPASRHTYYGQLGQERHNRMVTLGGSMSPVGSAFENVEGWNITGNSWDSAGTYGMCVGAGNGGWTVAINWSACRDPRNDNLYVIPGTWLRKFTPSTTYGTPGGTWSNFSALPSALNTGARAAIAVDTIRNQLLWIHGYATDITKPYTCNLSTGVWDTSRTHPASAAKTALDARTVNLGMIYSPQRDSFLVRGNNSGGMVFEIDANTLEVSQPTTNGGSGIPAGLSAGTDEEVYNRWNYLPEFGSAILFNRAEEDARILRLTM